MGDPHSEDDPTGCSEIRSESPIGKVCTLADRCGSQSDKSGAVLLCSGNDFCRGRSAETLNVCDRSSRALGGSGGGILLQRLSPISTVKKE